MWPISADNIGSWLGLATVVGGLISAWFYTQSTVRQHSVELGLGSDKTLRDRVLTLESENAGLKERVSENHKDGIARHEAIMAQLGDLGSKLDEIAKAVWTAAGKSD